MRGGRREQQAPMGEMVLVRLGGQRKKLRGKMFAWLENIGRPF
jgi:hypothetical protein